MSEPTTNQSMDAPEPGPGTPVKVLHLINGEFYAGAERVQELLAGRLPGSGYAVSFVCLKQGVFQADLEAGPFESRTLAMRSKIDLLRVARQVARHARDTDCRLIHTHTVRGAVVGALASMLSGLPMVHHVHSPAARDTTRRVSNLINTWAERLVLSRAATLIPVSRSLADYLREQGYPAQALHPIPNGVAVNEHEVRGTRQPVLTVGTVALFRPRKGIEVLLRALARLVDQGYELKLVAVGGFETPDYQETVLELCRGLGLGDRVEWRGFRQDVPAELERMDLFVLPSLFGEGMPMVVLEAMAVGLPVVATRVEGIPEVIRDGREGRLVAAGDAESLADAIGEFARQPELLDTMGSAGRRRQQSDFSDVAMAARLGDVYDRVLGRKRAAAGSRHRPVEGTS